MDLNYDEKVLAISDSYMKLRESQLSKGSFATEKYCYKLFRQFVSDKKISFDRMMEMSEDDLIKLYKVYLGSKGYRLYGKRHRKGRIAQDKLQEVAPVKWLRRLYRYCFDNSEHLDVYDIREIAKSVNISNPRYRLDFSTIEQPEIRKELERVLLYRTDLAGASLRRLLCSSKKFAWYLENRHRSVESFGDVKPQIVKDYVRFLKSESGLSNATINSYISGLTTILGYYNALYDKDLYVPDVHVRHIYNLPRPYSDAEIKRINGCVVGCDDKQFARLFMVHEMEGLRISDALQLKQSSLISMIIDGETAHFIRIVQQKTGDPYIRPITEAAAKLLIKAIEYSNRVYGEDEYIFVRQKGKIYTYSVVCERIAAMIEEANLLDDNGNRFKYCTHRMRMTFATKLLLLGLDDVKISKLLMHKSTRTVAQYRKITDGYLLEKTRKMRNMQNELLRVYGREVSYG